jgi:hypothetical protein
MQTAAAKMQYTPTEYLALENQAEFNGEYQNSKIILIIGCSFDHGIYVD